jgi:hypothetical protein
MECIPSYRSSSIPVPNFESNQKFTLHKMNFDQNVVRQFGPNVMHPPSKKESWPKMPLSLQSPSPLIKCRLHCTILQLILLYFSNHSYSSPVIIINTQHPHTSHSTISFMGAPLKFFWLWIIRKEKEGRRMRWPNDPLICQFIKHLGEGKTHRIWTCNWGRSPFFKRNRAQQERQFTPFSSPFH